MCSTVFLWHLLFPWFYVSALILVNLPLQKILLGSKRQAINVTFWNLNSYAKYWCLYFRTVWLRIRNRTKEVTGLHDVHICYEVVVINNFNWTDSIFQKTCNQCFLLISQVEDHLLRWNPQSSFFHTSSISVEEKNDYFLHDYQWHLPLFKTCYHFDICE